MTDKTNSFVTALRYCLLSLRKGLSCEYFRAVTDNGSFKWQIDILIIFDQKFLSVQTM